MAGTSPEARNSRQSEDGRSQGGLRSNFSLHAAAFVALSRLLSFMAAATPLSSSTDSQAWTRRFWLLLAGVVVFRMLYLAFAVDFQLSGDEAYYWDWGRRPDWCYYSKPPLIGWLMGLIGWLFGASWLAIRMTATLLGTATLALLFFLGRRLFDARTGFFAALLLLASPANVMSNFGLTIDAPLLVCWTAALLVFWHVLNEPRRVMNWVLLTLIVGIGTLAKQMMLAFPGLMIIFTLVSPEHRTLLKRPAFWLCILGSLAFLTPLIAWNVQHQWVTLTHTSEHFHHKSLGLLEWLVQFLTFPVLQAAMYSPVTWGVLMAVLWGSLRSWKSLELRQRFLVAFSAPGLAVFLVLALRQNIGPNWPAVFYVPLFVLAASLAPASFRLNAWMRRGGWVGGAMAALIYVYLPLIRPLGLAGDKRLDPCAPMRGWDVAGLQAGQFWDKMLHPESTFVLVLDHRRYASQMAFSMPQHPQVYRWTESGKIESQYEIWPDASDKIGWDCLVIFPDSEEQNYKKDDLPRPVRHAFDKMHKLGDVYVNVGRGVLRSFQVFQCKRMLHLPPTERAILARGGDLAELERDPPPSPPPSK